MCTRVENLRAAQRLIDARWPTLRVFMLPEPEMVHAKATLAYSSCTQPVQADNGSDGGDGADQGADQGPGRGRAREKLVQREGVAFLGSANLVRGSMNLPVHCGLLPYDELNVLVRDATFCKELDASMDGLFAHERASQ